MSDQRDLIAAVIQLANLLTKRLGPVFEKAGVTPQQWAVLSVVAANEPSISPAAIARRMGVSKQNMTGMVERLHQLGLIDRENDPNDLRTARVQLTRRGRALIERMRPAYEEWLEALRGVLPDRDLQTLERSVSRLISRLEQS
ncbi:MAG TPA: MarR family transcriptional regulator [Thermoanaerobaculia bacterium]|nr:MarR family transcriptional regulator [Thermoanaerobaculia bacterium]